MGSLAKPVVCIVTPGTRTANNGNWRTAARWAGFLRGRCKVIVQTQWDGARADILIALHARHSAESVAAFRATGPHPIVVMLTGTDLYRDLPASIAAARSLDLANRIVVLQDDAPRLLEPRWREKAEVIFQSARPLAARRRANARLECIAVGHLRAEKDPVTLFRAIQGLPSSLALRVTHIGAPLDAAIAAQARRLHSREPRYRYLGALPHGLTRCAIKAADLLIHPSAMEGGANVIVEAVTCGTPVMASRVSGNVGMLGASYSGYFETGDASALARRLEQAVEEHGFVAGLERECRARARLFRPAVEAAAVRRLVARLVA
ncbi:MAG TPA: selenoneine biosynthesis selenosugar synthase SenB [Usitatibacter sp.]|nr:selenoneine biosynthesis selenosugar synthase SenB [Usitatibacter sp.]